METLKQVLTIPENHQLHFDITLPADFPTGPAEVVLIFAPHATPTESTNISEILKLAGTLKDSPRFGGDPLTIQKALRDEWER